MVNEIRMKLFGFDLIQLKWEAFVEKKMEGNLGSITLRILQKTLFGVVSNNFICTRKWHPTLR